MTANTQTVWGNQPFTSTTGSSGTTSPSPGTSESWTVSTNAGFGTASTGPTPNTIFHVCDPQAPTEMITVTSNPSTTWTVTRGAGGTTPVSHQPGATFYQVSSAGDMANLLQMAGNQTINPGSLTISNGLSAGAILAVTNTTSSPTAPNLQSIAAASGDAAFGVEVSGDADFRLTISGSGQLAFGPGSAVTDSTFGRVNAGSQPTLQSSVPLSIASGVLSSTLTNALQISGSDTTNYYPRAQDGNGVLWDMGEYRVAQNPTTNISSVSRTSIGRLSDPSSELPTLQPNITYIVEFFIQWTPSSGGGSGFNITFYLYAVSGLTSPSYSMFSAMSTTCGSSGSTRREQGSVNGSTPLSVQLTTTGSEANWTEFKGVIRPATADGGVLGVNANVSNTSLHVNILNGSYATFRPISSGPST